MIHDVAMSSIGQQLRRAQEKNYLIDLTEDAEVIVAVFSPQLHQATVDAVIGHIMRKYGNFVVVVSDKGNTRQIEIINKLRFSLDVV